MVSVVQFVTKFFTMEAIPSQPIHILSCGFHHQHLWTLSQPSSNMIYIDSASTQGKHTINCDHWIVSEPSSTHDTLWPCLIPTQTCDILWSCLSPNQTMLHCAPVSTQPKHTIQRDYWTLSPPNPNTLYSVTTEPCLHPTQTHYTAWLLNPVSTQLNHRLLQKFNAVTAEVHTMPVQTIYCKPHQCGHLDPTPRHLKHTASCKPHQHSLLDPTPCCLKHITSCKP